MGSAVRNEADRLGTTFFVMLRWSFYMRTGINQTEMFAFQSAAAGENSHTVFRPVL